MAVRIRINFPTKLYHAEQHRILCLSCAKAPHAPSDSVGCRYAVSENKWYCFEGRRMLPRKGNLKMSDIENREERNDNTC
jgi:hypothetical protein